MAAPTQVPAPAYLVTIGGVQYVTIDGITLYTLGGGGAGTIHTSAPLSGDGSVGTPATIAAGALPLTAIATQAANTFTANGTGGTASPTAISATAATALLNPATPSAAGLMSANLFALIGTDPAVVEMEAINALGLGLTQFKRIPVGAVPQGALIATVSPSDGATEGGARASDSTTAPDFFGASIFQAVPTAKWAFSFRSKLPIPGSGHIAEIGLVNAAKTHTMTIMSDFATDTTHYIIKWIGAGGTTTQASTVVVDNNYHWMRLTGDGTNVRLYIDNVLGATKALDANVAAEPFYPAHYADVLGAVVTSDIVYGYVAV